MREKVREKEGRRVGEREREREGGGQGRELCKICWKNCFKFGGTFEKSTELHNACTVHVPHH